MAVPYVAQVNSSYDIQDDRRLANLTVLVPSNRHATPDAAESCHGNWAEPHHYLYQMAHVAILIAFLAPTSAHGLLFMHCGCIFGFLLLASWSWAMLCAPDIFSWNFALCVINVLQVFFILYHMRPVRLAPELENVYETLFAPLKVTRAQFKKLVAAERCSVLTLHQGEAYATQEVTKTDRLGLLISGTVNVVCRGQFLHQIQERQFLDSPEFESSTSGEDKFHVSIVAATGCRYLCWQRKSLEYLFAKEPYVGLVVGQILGRDITNKLYLLNDKLKTQKGSRVDIRLPNVSSAAMSGIDLRSPGHSGHSGHSGSGIDVRSEIDDIDEDDLLDEINEKMPMFPNGGSSHAKLHLQLSGNNYSSL